MVASYELLTARLFGGISVALFIGMAGVRRIPWRHAALMGVGYVLVFGALWFALFRGVDPVLVLVGALGGVLVQRGFDDGTQERRRISGDAGEG